MKRPILALLTLPLLLLSCTTDNTKYHSQHQNIINGTPDTSQAHQAVVFVYANNGGACSGTLIAPNWVLTAAHCQEGVSSMDVYFGNDDNSFYDTRSVSQIIPHPQYVGTSQNVYNDICLLRLASAAPSNITPIPILPASLGIDSSDVTNLTLEFVGFGVDEYGQSGTKETTTSTLRGQCSGSQYCNIGQVSPYQIPPGSISYLQNPGGPCSGDSGGPAFIDRNGTEYVAGVTSYGDQNCTDYGVSTKVDDFEAWIVGYTGGTTSEICTNGTDDDGDGDVDCNDSDCATHAACQDAACQAPLSISCGQTISGNTTTGSSVYTTNACINQFTEDGPEVAYLLNVGTGTDVTVTMTMGSSNDMDIYLLEASCDPDSCVTGSANDAGQDETFQFTSTSASYYLLVETYNNAGAYEVTVACSGGTTPEVCDNDIDDDGDGDVDCNDSDCDSAAACQPGVEICNNGIDDDGDSAIDCGDSDCLNYSGCISEPENCTNGIDDDGDNLIDCDDADCSSLSSCTQRVEICDNGIDDDGDNAADCNDVDCASFTGCNSNFSEICDNGIDDDSDGKIDCNDPNCTSFSGCAAPKEICDNGIDDDGDHLTDCADADCLSYTGCSTTGREICNNGIDDDNDGAADCSDADCNSYSACSNPGVQSADDGCGCRSAGKHSSTSFSLLLLAALGTFIFRRKIA